MREEKAPGIAQPFMKTDPAFGRIGLEIRSNTIDLQSHSNLLVTARLQLRQVLPARRMICGEVPSAWKLRRRQPQSAISCIAPAQHPFARN
jgi:hypothetical protein